MENKVDEFCSQFCPYGYRDIEVCINNAEEAGKQIQDAVEMVKQYSDDTGTPLENCDPVACVYDALYQEARTDIERLTSKDISNDKPFDSIHVAGNYMATSLDAKQEAFDALKNLIVSINPEERTPVINWLYNHC